MNVEIRPGLPEDLPSIEEIIRAFSPLDADLAKPDLKGETYVAVAAGGRIVGVTGIIPDQLSPRVSWMGWTYLDANYEKPADPLSALRVWGQLLRHVEEIVSQRGKLLFISTSSHLAYLGAIRFYELHGYEVRGILPGYWGNGIDLIILCRPRAPARETVLPAMRPQGQEGDFREGAAAARSARRRQRPGKRARNCGAASERSDRSEAESDADQPAAVESIEDFRGQ